MRKITTVLGIAVLILTWSGPVLAQDNFGATLLGTGHDERVDGGDGCLNEADFVVGQYENLTQLQAGGNGYGCDSEWGAFAEFDFSLLPENSVISSAALTLRYTGYGDDAAGLPYLAIYGYDYGGGAVNLPRATLNEQTALAIFTPTSATNVDLTFDVTELVIELVLEQTWRTGFLVSGVFSEVGYNALVYFGGVGHAYPPRLVITTESPVAVDRHSWGTLKAVYR